MEKIYSTPYGDIHYWISPGPGDTCPLVFLPGLTADHRLFESQVTFFQATHPVLVWDAPGHGASRPFDLSFTLMEKAGWLHEILQLEGWDSPVLIGQSMGGYVAQGYLQQFPRDAAGFVSIDSAPLKRKYSSAADIWFMRHCEGMYRCYPWKALLRDGARGCAETPAGQALMKTMMIDYSKRDFCALAGYGYRILAQALSADLPYDLPCPTHLICGEHDRAGFTKRYNKAWAAGEGLPITWLPGAGHNSNTDCPQEVNQVILDFLTQLSPKGGRNSE